MNFKNILLLLSILLFSLTCDETTLPKDCLGIEGGSATIDECGVCDTDNNNNNIQCLDCAGEINGVHVYDECNICDTYTSYGGVKPSYPYAECDCDGILEGSATIDNCGTCDDDITNNCLMDCNSIWGGTAEDDECGVCEGDNSPNTGICDCFGVPGGTSEEDCADICGGDAVEDCAQICNGTSATDTADECCEGNLIDQCGICNGDNSPNTGICDCTGTPNGSAVVDNCDICAGDNSTCLDCAGELGGSAYLNECETCICNGSESLDGYECVESDECLQDCNNDWGGDAVEDNCGICDSDSTNNNQECIQDCNGDWDGGASIDCTGECRGGNTGLLPYEDCGCFINNADNYYCGNCFGNGEDCNPDCLSDGFAINPFINPDIDSSEENLPYCNEDESLTIDECLCGVGNLITGPTNIDFLGNCYYLGNFGLPGEICNDCDTGNTWNGGNIYHDSTICEYYGCTDVDAPNYDADATNCEDGSTSCCSYTNYLEIQDSDQDNTFVIFMDNSVEVGGFQVNFTNVTLTGASAGTAAANGFLVSATGGTTIGFSMTGATIPAGEEILTNLTYSNNNLDVLCINSITISDGSANALSFTIHHNSLCSE